MRTDDGQKVVDNGVEKQKKGGDCPFVVEGGESSGSESKMEQGQILNRRQTEQREQKVIFIDNMIMGTINK